MADPPRRVRKQCEDPDCDTEFVTGRRGRTHRYCVEHRTRPWLELRVIREKDGHTLASLAAASGIPHTYLCHLEQGQRAPGVQHVAALARALNVPSSILEPRTTATLTHDVAEATG